MRKSVEFKSVTISVFPVMFPSVLPLITNELVAVQPMPLPTCRLFDLDVRWNIDFDDPVDRERFPHDCPRCGGPAYVGLNDVDCSKGCD
jgi:hypothetical protein